MRKSPFFKIRSLALPNTGYSKIGNDWGTSTSSPLSRVLFTLFTDANCISAPVGISTFPPALSSESPFHRFAIPLNLRCVSRLLLDRSLFQIVLHEPIPDLPQFDPPYAEIADSFSPFPPSSKMVDISLLMSPCLLSCDFCVIPLSPPQSISFSLTSPNRFRNLLAILNFFSF